MPIPKKISPCPIVESVLEIRFETDFPSEAIFGLLYKALVSEYSSDVEKLPILQIPEQVRLKDPQLIHAPLYRLRTPDYYFQIGSNVLSVVNYNEYVGWGRFSKKLISTFKIVNDRKFISAITRVGLRYINFFEFDIFKHSLLQVEKSGTSVQYEHVNLRTIIKTSNFKTSLNIMNYVDAEINKVKKAGSIIDLDTFNEGEKINFFSDVEGFVNKLHDDEKGLFFNILKDEFIQSLNPVY